MKVIVEQGREGGQVISRIGSIVCLFPKRERNPVVGSEVEVMITGYQAHPETRRPRLFFVRPIRSDDRLVQHLGFEMAGSMCSTTAIPHSSEVGIRFLTPGRTNVYVAENVNYVGDEELFPRIPGWAYVKDERNARRIEGVPNLEQLDYWQHANNPAVMQVQVLRDRRHAEWVASLPKQPVAA